MVVANFWTYNIGVFFGYGDGTFSDQMTYPTGDVSKPNSVVVGDFNNDSVVDIAVTNQGTENIGILLGYGDGTFSNQTIYSTGNNSAPTTMTVGDFNNDTILDITVANFGTGNIGIFLGYGDGTFSNQTTFLTGNNSQPWWVAVGDFNNDHRLDIATANSGTNNIGVFVGFINGIFFSQMTYSTGDSSSPISVAVGDFNSDSRLDIVVANRDRGNIGLFFGYAHEGFLNTPTYSTGFSSRPAYVVTGYFDNDTQLDIAVANNGTDNIIVLLGSGFGTFSSQTNYSTGNGSQPCSIAIGDFNNDSIVDIAVANYGFNNIGVFLGHGDGTFSGQTTYSTGTDSQPDSVAVCDFNNDHRLDIAVANDGSNNVGLFLGYGNGSFMSQIIFSSGFNSQPSALAVGDVNGDHVMDFIAANSEYGNFEVLSRC
jgi:predicted nucleotidyltransferase